MTNKYITRKRFIPLILLLLSICLVGHLQLSSQQGEEIIAEVEGVAIRRKDIEPSPDLLEYYKRIQKPLEGPRLKLMQEELLLSKIKKIIIKLAVEKLGIKIADEEITQCITDLKKELSLSKKELNEWLKNVERVYELLEIYLSNPDKADALYNQELKDVFGTAYWQSMKTCTTSREKLLKERKTISHSWDEFFDQAKKDAIPILQKEALGDFYRKKMKKSSSIKPERIETVYRKHYLIDSVKAIFFSGKDQEALQKVREEVLLNKGKENILDQITYNEEINIETLSFRTSPLSLLSPPSYYQVNLMHEEIYRTEKKKVSKLKEYSPAGGETQYFFVYVTDLKKKNDAPPFEEVKEEIKRALKKSLLRDFYNEWLVKELKTADIKIHDPQFSKLIEEIQK